MRVKVVKVLLVGGTAAAVIAIGPTGFAQGVAPPAASSSAGGIVQPHNSTAYAAQPTETRGRFRHFTLTPISEIDGVILADCTEVHLPPHLTAQIAKAIKIGDDVVAQGYRSSFVPFVVASSIMDASTGQTVVDAGPPPPGGDPTLAARRAAGDSARESTSPLYGPAGDLNGALLDDGTVVRIGPREARTRWRPCSAPAGRSRSKAGN